jgi:LytS/YehU family sensor histidine kinase
MAAPHENARASDLDWRLAAKCILGFMALHLVYRAITYALGGRVGSMLDPTLWYSTGLALVLSFGLCGILGTIARRGLAIGLASAVVLALPTSVAFAGGDLGFYYNFSPELNEKTITTRTLPDGTVLTQSSSGEISYRRSGEARPTVLKLSPLKERVRDEAIGRIARNASSWYFFYFGLGAFFVGLSSARRLQAAERRASEFERLAHSAQLRALRYQVNPHFLFNTLNSLSSLIMARRLDDAETMILNLSDFFRSALAIDPTVDVTLVEEIRLQRLYLDVERARFLGRLQVNVTVPSSLEAAQVPALLLQPLVENAIKHAVARTTECVTLDIVAEALGEGAMRLLVDDSGGADQESRADCRGTGVGLSNVGERLKARFGAAASLEYGLRSGGGFRVVLTLPLVLP